MARTCMLNTAALPRIRRSTGNALGSNAVKAITVEPAAVRLATADSKVAASTSGSARARSRSLPPAAKLTRSGAIAIAAGTCSSSSTPSVFPRIARLAYFRPGCSLARSSANRSAQPRHPAPSMAGSPTPPVKLSPRAANDPISWADQNRRHRDRSRDLLVEHLAKRLSADRQVGVLQAGLLAGQVLGEPVCPAAAPGAIDRSEEHTSELQ